MKVNKPHFEGTIKTLWLSDGRKMILIEDYTFVDECNTKWTAPKATVIDGASIPRLLWRLGSPYSGKYRNASVIHDYFCQIKTISSDKVHKMFYEAMLCSGVVKYKAYIMYLGVKLFGPKF